MASNGLTFDLDFMTEPDHLFEFSILPGYFTHDQPESIEERRRIGREGYTWELTTAKDLGIIPQRYDTDTDENADLPQWKRLQNKLDDLNRNAKEGEQYRLLFVLRHGQGLHNWIQGFVKKSWHIWNRMGNTLEAADQPELLVDEMTEKLSKSDICIFDPSLTKLGELQAINTGKMIRDSHVPLPKIIYASPFRRCIQTSRLVYDQVLGEASGREKIPDEIVFYVKEMLREHIGRHKCDSRHSLSWAKRAYSHDNAPGWFISEPAIKEADLPDLKAIEGFPRRWVVEHEPGFSSDENDPYWFENDRECPYNLHKRAISALNDVFSVGNPSEGTEINHDVVAFGIHSRIGQAVLKVVGFPEGYQPFPGEMIPLMVKAVEIKKE